MKRLFLLIGIIIQGVLGYTQDIQIKASAPAVVTSGQQFRLTYTSNEEISNFALPDIRNFTVLSGPNVSSNTSIQIINRKTSRSSTYTYTYILQAIKEGEFEIPAYTFKVNGQSIRSNSLRIQVSGGGSQSAPQRSNQSQSTQGQVLDKNDFFIKAFVSNTHPYIEEQVIVHYKLYLSSQAQGYQASIKKSPQSTGFWTYELNDRNVEPPQSKETINGKTYIVVDLYDIAVFPQKSGQLTISPLELQVIVQIPIQQQARSNNPWDMFFNDPFFGMGRLQNIELNVVSNSVTLYAKELPQPKPSDFSGLTGDFSIQTKITKDKLSTDDATNFIIRIKGSGNIQHIEAPDIQFSSDFDVHEPIVTDNIQKTPNGISGTRSFEYVLIPRNAGDFTIPQAAFTYFDKNKKQYISIQSKEVPLHVVQGKNQGRQYMSSTNKKNVTILGDDIRFIQTKNPTLRTKASDFFLSPLYYFLLFIPFIGFVLFYILLRKQIENKKNLAMIKDKNASKLARKRLQKAEKYLKSGDKEQFYIAISQALWGYISDKFYIPLMELSLDTTRCKLEEKSLNAELIDECMNVLTQCEYARFAPATAINGKQMYETTFQFISKIENELKKNNSC